MAIKGDNASYIPDLHKVNPNIYAISICNINGEVMNFGDYQKEVGIESVSKVFTLALALQKYNIKTVLNKIGNMSEKHSFNSINDVIHTQNHTINSFVNAGAIATTSLLYNKNKTKDENQKDFVLNFISDNAIDEIVNHMGNLLINYVIDGGIGINEENFKKIAKFTRSKKIPDEKVFLIFSDFKLKDNLQKLGINYNFLDFQSLLVLNSLVSLLIVLLLICCEKISIVLNNYEFTRTFQRFFSCWLQRRHLALHEQENV